MSKKSIAKKIKDACKKAKLECKKCIINDNDCCTFFELLPAYASRDELRRANEKIKSALRIVDILKDKE